MQTHSDNYFCVPVIIKFFHLLDAPEDRRNDTALYNPFVIESLEVLDGHPPTWVDYINKMVGGDRIPNSEIVIIKNPKYMKKFANVLRRTNARTVSNYLMWRVVMSKMSDLNQAAGKLKEKFNREVNGINSDPPRWKKCVKEVGFQSKEESSLRYIASSMYIKKYFKSDAKAEMIEMIKNIKSSFKKVVEEVSWMDQLTKSKALKKLKAMTNYIAYPEELTNEKIVTQHHSGLKIEEDDFYGNKLRISLWNRLFKHSLLREKVDKTDWRGNDLVPVVVNAWYSETKNFLQFPAGILQGAFFHYKELIH